MGRVDRHWGASWPWWENLENAEVDKGDHDIDWIEEVSPEAVKLPLPSSLSTSLIKKLKIENLANNELEMRQGQANDAIDGLMLALCTQWLLLCIEVRRASGTKTKTRAFGQVAKARKEVEAHVQSYRRSRKAILALSTDQALIEKYRPITKSDIKTSDVTDERQLGQSMDTLAWFWRLGTDKADKNEWTEECKFFNTY